MIRKVTHHYFLFLLLELSQEPSLCASDCSSSATPSPTPKLTVSHVRYFSPTLEITLMLLYHPQPLTSTPCVIGNHTHVSYPSDTLIMSTAHTNDMTS